MRTTPALIAGKLFALALITAGAGHAAEIKVLASNASELMSVSDVDGALVGGASLKADEFLAIAGVYR